MNMRIYIGRIHLHISNIAITASQAPYFSFHFVLVPYIFALLYILNKLSIKYIKTANIVYIEHNRFIRNVNSVRTILSGINSVKIKQALM